MGPAIRTTELYIVLVFFGREVRIYAPLNTMYGLEVLDGLRRLGLPLVLAVLGDGSFQHLVLGVLPHTTFN